jgi:pimeloyl-ACP methyl ester carboxylesterase
MTQEARTYEVESDWVHLKYPEVSAFRDVYGFASQQGLVNVEGIRYRPKGKPSKTLLYYMHPSSTLQILPVPRRMAERGAHVLCAGSRYARNDTPLIMEKVLLDIAAYFRHAKEVWGYEKIVLVGWSGGGSLSMCYQAQAERPSITATPAGEPIDLKAAKLIPADAMIWQAAHLSRAVVLRDFIDPSVIDEENPDRRDESLDLYHPSNKPPYSKAFLERFRAAQLARIRRRTAWVKEMLQTFKKRGGKELERGFIVHRTMAEPRWLDGNIDPNDRKIGTCWIGDPETVNTGPIAIGRFSTLRSWLSQWSIDDTNCNAERDAANISVPLLAMENSADDSVPQPHTKLVHDLAGSKDKTMKVIKGANHYYVGQPELLSQAVETCLAWMAQRRLVDG